MAEIDNPQLRSFCNDSLRRVSNQLADIDQKLKGIIAEYNAKNIGTIISDAGASNFVTDGSATDGRTRVTGGDVYNVVTLLTELQTFITQGRRDVLAKWQVNAYQP